MARALIALKLCHFFSAISGRNDKEAQKRDSMIVAAARQQSTFTIPPPPPMPKSASSKPFVHHAHEAATAAPVSLGFTNPSINLSSSDDNILHTRTARAPTRASDDSSMSDSDTSDISVDTVPIPPRPTSITSNKSLPLNSPPSQSIAPSSLLHSTLSPLPTAPPEIPIAPPILPAPGGNLLSSANPTFSSMLSKARKQATGGDSDVSSDSGNDDDWD